MITQNSIIDREKEYEKIDYIKETDEEINFEPLNNRELFSHQKKEVLAMKKLEETGYFNIKDNQQYPDEYYSNTKKIKTNYAYYKDAFGTGKTTTLLALIACSNPINKSLYKLISNNNKLLPVKIKYPDDLIVDITVIFVGKVFNQWKLLLEENKDKLGKCFYIDNYRNFVKFCEYWSSDKISDYKIILIKTGIMGSKKFDTEVNSYIDKYNYYSYTDKKSIVHIFAELTKNYCFKRLIFDDIDQFNQANQFPFYSVYIPTLFSWYVSATSSPIKEVKPTGGIKKFEDISNHYDNYSTFFNWPVYSYDEFSNYNLIGYKNPKVNFKNTVTIKADPDFIEKSINTTIYNFYTITIKNPFENTISIIGEFGTEQANEIQQALNGDATTKAAELAGILTENPVDILEKLLEKEYKTYKKNVLLETHIINIKNIVTKLPFGEYDEFSSNKFISILKKKEILNTETYYYKNNTMIDIIENLLEETIEKKQKAKIIIDRVKDRIKDGYCIICCDDLSQVDCGITKCCGSVFCGGCIGQMIKQKFSGDCFGCRKTIHITGIVFIKSDTDIEQILEENTKIIVEKEIEEQQKDKEKKDEINNLTKSASNNKEYTEDDINYIIDNLNKQKIIYNLVKGIDNIYQNDNLYPNDNNDNNNLNENKLLFDVGDILAINKLKKDITNELKIESLLEGKLNIPQEKDIKPKVLIFAKYNETINKLNNYLNEKNIKSLILKGSIKQITNTINLFKNSDEYTCLIINSEFNCAGHNLQFATSLIFTHRIVNNTNNDRSVEAQIIGRAQRYGRSCNLKVYWVLYENEQLKQKFE